MYLIDYMFIDGELISGEFFCIENVVPKDKQWLFKYFTLPLHRQLVAYYFRFNDLRNVGSGVFLRCFLEHTGLLCSKRCVQVLVRRIICLLDAEQVAKVNFDLETLESIKSGKHRDCYVRKK